MARFAGIHFCSLRISNDFSSKKKESPMINQYGNKIFGNKISCNCEMINSIHIYKGDTPMHMHTYTYIQHTTQTLGRRRHLNAVHRHAWKE
jgi:hypothetical protein